MGHMWVVSRAARTVGVALITLLLGLRILSPAGFMPDFDHGAVTLVACPDTELPAMSPGAMRHQHDKKHPSPCPYASASSLSALGEPSALLFDALMLGGSLLLGRTFLFIERYHRRDRPPLRGPPLLA